MGITLRVVLVRMTLYTVDGGVCVMSPSGHTGGQPRTEGGEDGDAVSVVAGGPILLDGWGDCLVGAARLGSWHCPSRRMLLPTRFWPALGSSGAFRRTAWSSPLGTWPRCCTQPPQQWREQPRVRGPSGLCCKRCSRRPRLLLYKGCADSRMMFNSWRRCRASGLSAARAWRAHSLVGSLRNCGARAPGQTAHGLRLGPLRPCSGPSALGEPSSRDSGSGTAGLLASPSLPRRGGGSQWRHSRGAFVVRCLPAPFMGLPFSLVHAISRLAPVVKEVLGSVSAQRRLVEIG